ncbi:MAG: DEAD/DEAH box helicase [Burkholderiales bacterium]
MTTETQFAGLGLTQPLLRAIDDAGYTIPTPIQVKAIPVVLAGGDLLAAAQTGTGKTAGFVLPILHRLLATSPTNDASRPGRPRCLILTPTRELAAQVEEAVRAYGKHVPIRSMVMFGGVGIQPQVTQLRKRVDILVATPGRLLDHAGQRTVDLSGVEILVLDEGDRMLDMGFIHDIRRILAMMPKQKQSMLFSATFSDEVRALAATLLKDPASVEVAPRNTACELVQQVVHLVAKDQKRDVLSHLIRHNSWEQVLVFTRTKHGANRLAEKLEKDGIAAVAIHGNKSQSARTRALAQFKKGEVPVLVATDIAARGLDIEELPHVVNFELPMVAEDYIHRIGRTGRAGISGAAVSLVDPEEVQLLRAIEKLIKRPIERVAVEGFIAPKFDRAERELEKRQDNQRPAHHIRSARERQPERQHRGRSVEQPRRGDRGVQRPNAIDGTRVARVRDAEARGNRAPNGRDDDSRGNRIHANVSDDAQRHPTRSFSHNDSSRKRVPAARRDEPHNRPGRNEDDDNRGNRVNDERAMGASSNRALPADDSNEAARHQAMPQPALFSPRPQQRRRG